MKATKDTAWPIALLIAAAAFGLYAATAAPWITWAHDGADGGDLISAAMTGGVPHPHGYPTYCLLSRLWAFLPWGSLAHRFNLFSAAAAAASAALLFGVTRRLLPETNWRSTRLGTTISALVSLAWATGHTLWSQAIITEVYALAAMFAALVLYMLVMIDSQNRTSHWLLLGAICGLGLGAHLTMMLLWPAVLIILWPRFSKRRLAMLALGFCGGLAIFAYLPLAARQCPPVNWGNPQTWRGFWWLVSGKPYRGYLMGLPLASLPERLGAWVQLWARQFTPLGLALALLGLWSMLEDGQRRWGAASLLIWGSAVAYSLTYDTTDSYVYLLPSYMMTCLWLAQGALALIRDLAPAGTRQKAARAIVILALAFIPTWAVQHHYRELDLSHDNQAWEWLVALDNQLPPDALLITGQDRHTFTLQYARWVEGWRQDIIMLDGELLQYDWYRQQLEQQATANNIKARTLTLGYDASPPSLAAIVDTNLGRRPIYLSSPRPELDQELQIEQIGVLWRVSGRRGDAG